MPLDKWFDTNFATPKTFGLFSLLHDAPDNLASLIAFNGWGHLWPGYHADTDSGAEARLVEPHSPSIFAGSGPALQGPKIAWAGSRSPNRAADGKAV